MPVLLILFFLLGIIVFKKGYYHYLRGKGYRAEDAIAINSQGKYGRSPLYQAFLDKKRGPDQKKDRKELRKGILIMLVGIALSLSGLFILLTNYIVKN